jgi:ABC-type transporter lipoprotein component MlaA/pimeloyl-ACP methyl ester carboxylesterase
MTTLPSNFIGPLMRRSVWLRLFAMAASLIASNSPTAAKDRPSQNDTPASQATFPEFMADPFEPVNRGIWTLNREILLDVIQPTGRVYRTVTPAPVRQSIKNFTRNISYPGRLVNHALQGKWTGASDESLRFLCNSTVGIGGLIDVASGWKIPKSEADFAGTFNQWGWHSSRYLVLPFFGPSDASHTVGLALDKVAQPWNYESRYDAAAYVSTYNSVTEHVENAAQFIRSEADPYVGARYAWSYASKFDSPDWRSDGEKDLATLQTLGVTAIDCKDPKFIERGHEMSVRLSSTGRRMRFNCWLQPKTAPLVYIAPGLGSHRLSKITLALAEHLYQNGYSVVTTTGVFHPEFMEQASTAALPGYPPIDCHDLWVELTEIDRLLEKKNPGRFLKKAFIGFSMGGFQSLYLASHEKQEKSGLLRFDRYVAIDPPVDLNHGNSILDRYYNAPLAWPADARQARVNLAVHKAAKLATLPPSPGTVPPFDATESKYLIGLSFRLTLRDSIYSSQKRHNLGILQTPFSALRREASYREISNYSFQDYFQRFVIPHYNSHGIGTKEFNRKINLKTYGKELRNHPKVRVVANRNDFLLPAKDAAWLESTLGPARLKILPDGGHLGNLTSPPIQSAVIDALAGLK